MTSIFKTLVKKCNICVASLPRKERVKAVRKILCVEILTSSFLSFIQLQ